MDDPRITGVPDTAFMVAGWRAEESQRPDALFRDPYADRLAGARGLALAEHLSARRLGQWQVAIRTVIIDEMLRAAVAGGVQTVLNLGAGLDTRPYRLAWPAGLRWIEVDFPQMLDWKEERLREVSPGCRLERVRLDLTDVGARRRLFEGLGADAASTLVLTEGVVPYLTYDAVGALADDLHRLREPRWIVDYFSPQVMRFRRRQRIARQMEAAPFQFAPPDWFGFFEGHGWRPLEMKYLVIEGQRLGRPVPLPTLLKLALRLRRALGPASVAGGFKKFAGYVMLGPRPARRTNG